MIDTDFKHQRFRVYFVVFLTALLWVQPVWAQKGNKIRTVVIDAGHGGRDPGAIGSQSKEKNIVLDVALLTGKLIKQNLPDVRVVFTRTKDEFIELHRRAAIANENEADLFISIHCNASTDKKVYGAETYVMGENKTEANLEVAKLENAAILFEENASEEYGGFDPNSAAAYIALSLYQSENKQQSLKIAQAVQEQFTQRVGRKDRSVQQASFLVLYKTAMPSILVELGFITNPAEEKFLMSEDGKTYMASAIYRAFRDYKTRYDRSNAAAPEIPEEWKEVLVPDVVKAEKEKKQQTADEEKAENKPEIKAETKKDSSPPVAEKTATTAQKTNQNQADTVKKTESEETVPKTEAGSQAVVFKVQFATFQREIPLNDKRFNGLTEVSSYFHNGVYKYTSGRFNSFAEATKHQTKLRGMGFSDAFVVAFENQIRVEITSKMRGQ
ncbi:MAG: N-acetylmuramoyl-L-alanine amidase [Bacteroidales bacterium]|nr:N-acetylmuramoyl-L-alanine amidase [Bacteroidales bacterium]